MVVKSWTTIDPEPNYLGPSGSLLAHSLPTSAFELTFLRLLGKSLWNRLTDQTKSKNVIIQHLPPATEMPLLRYPPTWCPSQCILEVPCLVYAFLSFCNCKSLLNHCVQGNPNLCSWSMVTQVSSLLLPDVRAMILYQHGDKPSKYAKAEHLIQLHLTASCLLHSKDKF